MTTKGGAVNHHRTRRPTPDRGPGVPLVGDATPTRGQQRQTGATMYIDPKRVRSFARHGALVPCDPSADADGYRDARDVLATQRTVSFGSVLPYRHMETCLKPSRLPRGRGPSPPEIWGLMTPE